MTVKLMIERRKTGITANSYSAAYGSAYWLLRRDELRGKARQYRSKNAAKLAKAKRIYWLNNKAKLRQQITKWNCDNAEALKATRRAYYVANREKIALQYRQRLPEILKQRRERAKIDENVRIRASLRSAMNRVLASRNQGLTKDNRTLNMIGCSFEFLKAHLESQFREGMTWQNYGRYGWHIDHIIPCAHFDLRELGQRRLCFHFTNLQPLWAEENLRKGSRISA